MFNKVLGALADKTMPKTQAWLERQVSLAVGDIMRRPEGGISFMDHFQKTEKTSGAIAASVLRLLGDDLAKRFQPERKGDLTLSVHYRKGPRPGISVGVYLIEGDHIFEPVFEFVDLEFAPDPADLIPLPYTPLTPPESLKRPADIAPNGGGVRVTPAPSKPAATVSQTAAGKVKPGVHRPTR